jgi:hypothetical protein
MEKLPVLLFFLFSTLYDLSSTHNAPILDFFFMRGDNFLESSLFSNLNERTKSLFYFFKFSTPLSYSQGKIGMFGP